MPQITGTESACLHQGRTGATNVNWVIHMIDYSENFDEDIFSWDDFAALEEEDLINRIAFSLERRDRGHSLAAEPHLRSLSGWEVHLFRACRETDRIEILAPEIGDAIRLLRGARRQIRWSRIKQVARNPRGCIRFWMKKTSGEWANRWRFFTMNPVANHRREGLPWAGSIKRSLPLLLKWTSR